MLDIAHLKYKHLMLMGSESLTTITIIMEARQEMIIAMIRQMDVDIILKANLRMHPLLAS